jgi:hypothetical protein
VNDRGVNAPADRGASLLVLLDVDVLFRGDPNETAPALLPSLVALFEGATP